MECPKCHYKNPDNVRFCSSCGTQLPPSEEGTLAYTKTFQKPPKELSRGTTFTERYEIIEVLGKGGMGTVFRVMDNKINEEVALKVLNPEVASDKNTIDRFRNELKYARKITHKNVCRMHDLNEAEGIHYITMEYVRGEDLKSFIKRVGQLPVGKAISIAKQVCEGLAEAHKLEVVHRDLKPQNIMIDNDGNALIMDFGIAHSLERKGVTQAGAIIGTPKYMSPEQVDGEKADQRSDIYSLGVVLYEMVTGKVPFDGNTTFSIALKHKSETPRDPRELNTHVPEDISRVILKCMEKDKEKRYQGVEELLSELEKIEIGLSTTERILPKKKHTSLKKITAQLRIKKFFIPAITIITLAILLVIAWQLLLRKPAAPITDGKPSLAIMYFENNTGDTSLDHWRKALSELLIADLSQSKYINVLSGDKLFKILKQLNQLEAKSYSSEVLKRVAELGKANHILRGGYHKAGDVFRINIMLQRASTGESIGSEMVQGQGEESVFPMVDDLTRKIKARYRLSEEEIASDIDKEIGKITTTSPEAYRYYSEGIKHGNTGDFNKCISLLERAVAIDPEFATAYRTMAVAYGNLGYQSKEKEYIEKAMKFVDRIPDRERYEIQGDFYWQSEKTYDKAIKAYNKLLMLYPEDRMANTNLGLLYSIIEQWDKAIERLDVNKQNKVETFYTYVNLAIPYMAKGLYEKAREVLEYYLNNVSEHALIHDTLAINYLCQGKYELALKETDKTFSLNPDLYVNLYRRGDIYHCKGDLAEAEKKYEKLLEAEEEIAHLYGRDRLGALSLSKGKIEQSKSQLKQGIELAEKIGEMEWKTNFNFQLTYMHLKSGNYKQALAVCEKALRTAIEEERLDWQRCALHLKGLSYLGMKSIEKAQKTAYEFMELIPRGFNRKKIRYYHHLMGIIELERENYSKAIEYFKKALSLLPSQHWPDVDKHALFIDSLASTYYKAGDIKKAQKEYERITSLTTGRLHYGDIFAKSFYMLGKIHQDNGWKEKAIEHYKKFLALWKDADPDTPESIDAKKQLVSLQTQ